jgi:hypothetical protein
MINGHDTFGYRSLFFRVFAHSSLSGCPIIDNVNTDIIQLARSKIRDFLIRCTTSTLNPLGGYVNSVYSWLGRSQ